MYPYQKPAKFLQTWLILTKIWVCHKLSGEVTNQKFHQVCHSYIEVMNYSKLYSMRLVWKWEVGIVDIWAVDWVVKEELVAIWQCIVSKYILWKSMHRHMATDSSFTVQSAAHLSWHMIFNLLFFQVCLVEIYALSYGYWFFFYPVCCPIILAYNTLQPPIFLSTSCPSQMGGWILYVKIDGQQTHQ